LVYNILEEDKIPKALIFPENEAAGIDSSLDKSATNLVQGYYTPKAGDVDKQKVLIFPEKEAAGIDLS